jgi:hypothetical protein
LAFQTIAWGRYTAYLGCAILLAATASGITAVFLPSGLPIATTLSTVGACNTNPSNYYRISNYGDVPGGADGSAADAIWGTQTPYVCNPNSEHTLETVFLYLPYSTGGNEDTLENGAIEGYVCGTNGVCSDPTGQIYFYQAANIYSRGNGGIQVEWPAGDVIHDYYVQEEDISNELWAVFTTDVTQWAKIQIPAGDNPGTVVSTQGEVWADGSDEMGPATITNDEYHAGVWYSWSSTMIAYDSDATGYCYGFNSDFMNSGPYTTCPSGQGHP